MYNPQYSLTRCTFLLRSFLSDKRLSRVTKNTQYKTALLFDLVLVFVSPGVLRHVLFGIFHGEDLHSSTILLPIIDPPSAIHMLPFICSNKSTTLRNSRGRPSPIASFGAVSRTCLASVLEACTAAKPRRNETASCGLARLYRRQQVPSGVVPVVRVIRRTSDSANPGTNLKGNHRADRNANGNLSSNSDVKPDHNPKIHPARLTLTSCKASNPAGIDRCFDINIYSLQSIGVETRVFGNRAGGR